MMLREARSLAQKIFERGKNAPLQVFIRIKKGILVRFTNNGVHQNGFQDLFSYTVRGLTTKGPVWVESNDASEEGIRGVVEGVTAVIARQHSGCRPERSEGPLDPSAASPPQDDHPREHFPLPLNKTPELAAQAIGEAVQIIRRKQASANGYFSAYERFFYLADSDGHEFSHPATAVRLGVTATKGAGKGYFSFYHPDPRKLKVRPVVEEAMKLAEAASRSEQVLSPGEYECIFSPRALLELLEPVRRHFDRQLSLDQKSVFSGQLGQRIFSKALTLWDNVAHSGQFGVPFDAEGAPKKKVTLVEAGVLKELLAEGHSTRGWLEPPFYPQNLVIEKGKLSLQEMIRKIQRGLFINKIWYHALVRESEMEVTGLATAGSIYIEGGKIRGRAVPLRYHDSLFSILNSVVATSKEQSLLKDGEMGAALFPYVWVSRLRVV